MLTKILLVIVGLLLIAVGAVLVLAAFKPDQLDVQRSIVIAAPSEKIQPLIDDFHRWSDWSPYEHRDPNLQRTFSGAERSVGAVYEWSGNKDVGSGRMEVLESSPEQIKIQLDFITPFEGHNLTYFKMAPQGNATEVTWHMQGPAAFMTKVMCVFMDMDKMIGTDFANGLATLKSVAEKQ
jgi:hypothetical protein